MRITAAALLFLTATCAANAQCALGAFPTTNGDGQIVCQSAAGQRPPSAGFDPGGGVIGNCPTGATAGVDSWGNRTCSSLSEQTSGAAPQAAPAKKAPPRKRFEISKKCPECK
jgi:hypothetical protein